MKIKKEDNGGRKKVQTTTQLADTYEKYVVKKVQESKWTIEYVASQEGKDDNPVEFLERGRSSQPFFSHICKIGETLGVNFDEIY